MNRRIITYFILTNDIPSIKLFRNNILKALLFITNKDKEEITKKWRISEEYYPSIDEEQRTKLYKGWKKAVSRSLAWEEEC